MSRCQFPRDLISGIPPVLFRFFEREMGALDRKKEKGRVRLPQEYNEYNALKMQFPLFSSRRKEWSFRPLYPTMNLELFFLSIRYSSVTSPNRLRSDRSLAKDVIYYFRLVWGRTGVGLVGVTKVVLYRHNKTDQQHCLKCMQTQWYMVLYFKRFFEFMSTLEVFFVNHLLYLFASRCRYSKYHIEL